jgi:putative ABC transport system substrate-binding protein
MAGLREYGYLPGQNLVIECRYTEGRAERGPVLAAELVSLKPDLLVVFSTANVRAAKQATSTIPIVMVGVIDPVGRGLVASLAHPGGNVTGVTDTVGEGLVGKRLQLLKEAVPAVTRVAAVYAGNPSESSFWGDTQAAARALDVTLESYRVQDPSEFEGAFAAMTKAKVEALLVQAYPFMLNNASRIVDLAAQSRLPAMYPHRQAVQAGGLISYDVNLPDNFRRLGSYVDRIFKGANPGDLPVEQPTKFDLFINLKTAKALGLSIPPSLLMRADEVIE